MTISVTPEQVRALSPDDASIKAARSLTSPKPWSNLGRNERSVWGACQGSGKEPYRTQVDWQGPAFKCSCPSRKFPCKHGLAMLLLLAENPGLFLSSDEPDWVKVWIASRQQRSTAEPGPVDEAARAKRTEQRAGRISEGVDLLELWLRDLVHQGLASAPGRGFGFFDQQAARQVDAQAPGLARQVHALGEIAVSGEGWQDRMMRTIGRLVLLIHAFRRLDRLSPETQSDVRAAIGLPVAQSEVLALDPVRDSWLIAGQRVTQEDRLRVQRTWLWGERTGRPALLLDFAAGPAGFTSTFVPGTCMDADVCFFPGAAPLRALVKTVRGGPRPANGVCGISVATTYEQWGDRLVRNPWGEFQLALLKGVVPAPSRGGWRVLDGEGDAMPCVPDYALLALSGGRPIDLAGEWDGDRLKPLIAMSNDRMVAL